MTRKQAVEFGPFVFDTARALLFRGDAPVPLGKRGAALLAALLKRRGEILDKEELLDAAWPGTAVEEANLSVQIGLLRRALGRNADGREWIVTVQRIGYRFLPAAQMCAAASVLPTLAILPFTDFGTGAQREADGFVEDLTTMLARFKTLAVVARNISFQDRGRAVDVAQFAKRLGVAYVLEGSTRSVGGLLRVNVQLIDGATGALLWADTFDYAGDTGRLDRLVGLVAAMVEPRIQAAETDRARARQPENASARDLFLRARWHLRLSDERGNAAAYELLKRAIRIEPENIHILALGAEILHHRISVGWPRIGADDDKAALDFALRGVSLGIADGGSLGLFSNAMHTAREWDMARVTSERAVEMNSNSSMALVCAGMGSLWLGRTEEAAGYFERVAAHGPADPNIRFALTGLSTVNRRRGNYEVSIEYAKRALAVGRHSAAHWNLIASSVSLGRLADARRHLANFRAISPATIASIRRGQPVVDERLLDPVLEALAVAGLPEA